MVPDVAPLLEGVVSAGSPHGDDVLDGRGVGQRLFGVLFQRHFLPPSVAAVRRDQQLGLGVVDPVLQRLGGEAAEHDRMGRPDPRAGQHGDGELGDHPEVDGHAVALRHTERLEPVGEATDLFVQLSIGEGSLLARLPLPVVSDLVAAALQFFAIPVDDQQ